MKKVILISGILLFMLIVFGGMVIADAEEPAWSTPIFSTVEPGPTATPKLPISRTPMPTPTVGAYPAPDDPEPIVPWRPIRWLWSTFESWFD